MSGRRRKIEVAREQHELARLAAETARYNRAATVLNKYDALEPSRLRRQPTRETRDEGEIYSQSRRLLGCNLGRDLERNYSPAKAMLHQFRVNVVGSLGKLRVNAEGGDEATAWFNEVWSKDCDYRDDVDWSTQLQNILASVIREGDMLCVVDDGLVEDSGKLLTWEADQVVPVNPDLLPAIGYPGARQDNGILRNDWGKVLGYIATGQRGRTVLDKKEDAMVWAREQARLVKNPWRLNQGRGVPALITPSSNFIDLYEILSSELQSAKRAAKQYAFVKRSDAVTNWDSPTTGPEWLPENDGRTSASVTTDGANQSTHTAKNYEMLEQFTGGLTDYLDVQDSVEFPSLAHPNKEMAPFLDAVQGYSGSALGLARAYTLLRADSSYTSFRGDMIMSWVTFYWLQKRLERAIADWVAVRVLGWAQRRGEVRVLPQGWERSLSWTWPRMPEVDELDAENSTAAALKNGTTDYSVLLGPDWRKRMDDFAGQIEYARELGIPLGVFEQKSGGMANAKKDAAADEEN